MTLLPQADSCRKASNARADDKDFEPVLLMPVDAIGTIYRTGSHIAYWKRG